MTEVSHFTELAPDLIASAGGKGGMLARMMQAGYPAPEGFVILPQAFTAETLSNSARKQ
jgi:pyruvate,water dikinase